MGGGYDPNLRWMQAFKHFPGLSLLYLMLITWSRPSTSPHPVLISPGHTSKRPLELLTSLVTVLPGDHLRLRSPHLELTAGASPGPSAHLTSIRLT